MCLYFGGRIGKGFKANERNVEREREKERIRTNTMDVFCVLNYVVLMLDIKRIKAFTWLCLSSNETFSHFT